MENATLQLLVARIAVEDLISQYAMLFDSGDFDGLAELFTDDAVFNVSPSPSFMPAPLRGRTEIIKTVSRRYHEVSATGDRHQHVSTNTVFDELSETRCVTRTYLTTITGGPATPTGFAAFGTYHDVFQLDGDRWRFAERHLKTSNTIPNQ